MSASTGLRPHAPCRGFALDPTGDFRPPDPFYCTVQKILKLYYGPMTPRPQTHCPTIVFQHSTVSFL